MSEPTSVRLTRAERFDVIARRLAVAGAVALGLILAGLLIVNVLQTRGVVDDVQRISRSSEREIDKISRIARSNRALNSATLAAAERLEDCTTPAGKCYARQRAQTADAIGRINAITYLAVSCADREGWQTEREIRECVERQLVRPGQGTGRE